MSKRCELMHEDRKKMILLKSKAISLSQKAQSLVDRVKPEKKSLYTRMKLLKVKFDQKTSRINEALKNQEETMIRKGCPGLKYRGAL